MSNQTAGALETIAAGTYADVKFSNDGTKLFAVSGNTVSVIDVATGTVVAQYTAGSKLGAFDLSPDGHYLAVVETYGGDTDSVYRIDLTSGTVTPFSATPTSYGPFYDIAYLADGTAIVSQKTTGNGSYPLRVLDFTTGTYTIAGGPIGSGANIGMATLTASADHTHVLIEPYGVALSSYVYVSGSGIVEQTSGGSSDPYSGAALPPTGNGVQATSPDGSFYIQGQTLNVYDASLHLVTSLTSTYPYLAGAQGMAFSPDGARLYLASGSMVVVVDTSSWRPIGAYSIGDTLPLAHDYVSGTDTGFGDILQVSPDGHYVSVIGSHGIQLLDLTHATMDSTMGADTLSGAGVIFGLEGNDDLSGVGNFTTMYGGGGDDTYHITTPYDQAIELASQGHDTVHTIVSYTLADNVEDLVLDGSSAISGYGNALDNLIVGNDSANQLGGSFGNDHLIGGGGDDNLDGGPGNDLLDGGNGNDIANYQSASSGVTVDLSRIGAQDTIGAGTDTLLSIEGLSGSFHDDHLTGDVSANKIDGYYGNDVITGGLGADTLTGGEGADTFIDTAAGLNGDTITDFSSVDTVIIKDASLASFGYSQSGDVLTFTGGTLTFAGLDGKIVASAAVGGGVQLTLAPASYGTPADIANQLMSGYWDGDIHHWAVTQGGSLAVNITSLAADEQRLALAALAEWTDLIGVDFQEVATGGQIVFTDAEDSTANGPVAQTDSNWSNGLLTSATVDISSSWVSGYGNGLDSYSFQTYIHEIGHALGLGHAGDYNVTANYGSDAIFANDSWAMSVMSYFDQHENLYDLRKGFTVNHAVTPMQADVVAMQTLYGLSTTTRTGDSTYGYHSNVGGIYDATAYPAVAYTIFDSGGNDTVDYSGSNANQRIDLNPESFSNVNGYVANLSIARGVTIENAISGSGADTLLGNSADNVLTGNLGADVLTGGAGSDTFKDTAAGHDGDSITDFSRGDRIVFSDASLTGFVYSLSANVLSYSGGTIALPGLQNASIGASAAPEGGVQITFSGPPIIISAGGAISTVTAAAAAQTVKSQSQAMSLHETFSFPGEELGLAISSGQWHDLQPHSHPFTAPSYFDLL